MADNKNSKFAPKTGFFRGVVIAVNPTLEEANTLRGTTWDRPVEYLSKDKQNNDRVLVEFWIKDVESGTLFQQKYYISNVLRTSKSNAANKQWASNLGQTGWSENLADLESKSWWNESFPSHQLLVGEEGLVEFLAAWIVQGSRASEKFPMTDVNVSVDMGKLFKGDFSELKGMVGKYGQIVCLATINSFNGKEKQALWSKVLPGTDYFWQKVNSRDTNGIVGGWFSDIEDKSFGCKDQYKLEPMNTASTNSAPAYNAPANIPAYTGSHAPDNPNVGDLPF